jgi:hypothetical protein
MAGVKSLLSGWRKSLNRLTRRRSRASFASAVSTAATAVEEPVDLVNHLAERPRLRVAAGDALERAAMGWREVIPDEKMAMFVKGGDFGVNAFLARRELARGAGLSAPPEFGPRGLELPPNRGHDLKNLLVQFQKHMELADLMGRRTKNCGDGRWIQGRAIGGDAPERQSSGFEGFMETPEKRRYVGFGGVVIQDFVSQPPEMAVVHDGQHAVGPVVEFIGGDVAREVGQRLIQVIGGDASEGPFFPPLPPNSARWRRERRPGDRATDARTPRGTADRPPPPDAPPEAPPGGCSGRQARPSPTNPH